MRSSLYGGGGGGGGMVINKKSKNVKKITCITFAEFLAIAFLHGGESYV